MRSVVPDYDTRYAYGADGNRAAKWTSTKASETLYFNTMWTWHIEKRLSQEQQGQYSKHIYLGETRLVTKQTSDLEEHYGQSEELRHQYYYHPDHLGSAQLVTDFEGNEYQRIEYTPYGELWVEKKTANEKDMRYLPYKFTAKEQDEETGFYYYGARYLDAKYSRWISIDPALSDYLSKDYNSSSGGIFNPVNFNLYHYSSNNPIRYIDPDGKDTKDIMRGLIRGILGNPQAVQDAQSGVFPNEKVGFFFDASEGVYHTTFDCWQSMGGYNALYDVAFDLGTSMKAVKFEFSSGGDNYCLWGWKGDYLSLGAGCEMGLYRQADGKLGEMGHYLVDSSLAMDVQATLTVNGKNSGTYNSSKLGKHWWPAIFNPSQQGKNRDEIHAQYNLTMPNEQLYNDFKKRWKQDSRISNWNDKEHSFTVDY